MLIPRLMRITSAPFWTVIKPYGVAITQEYRIMFKGRPRLLPFAETVASSYEYPDSIFRQRRINDFTIFDFAYRQAITRIA